MNTALANVGLPTNLSFDPRIALTRDSLGAMLATVVVALEPRIPIAFVNVSPGGLPFPSFLHSPAFSELVTGVLITPLDIDSRIILGDPVADVRFDPMVMLLDNVIEAGDPQSFAPYLLAGELRGGDRPHFALNEAWEDEWVPNIATEGLAAAMDLPFFRLNLSEPPPVDPWLRFVTLPEVAGPSVAGNLDSGGQTAAFILWHPATHGLSYWYEDVLKMEPGFPPFVMRPSATRLNNPTLEIQTMRASFFADFFADLTPALVDPY